VSGSDTSGSIESGSSVADRSELADLATDPTASEEFDLHGLRRVRDFVAEYAGRAGLAPARVDDLVLAVNEITTNAVLHGGGRGRAAVGATADGMYVAVTDWGRGLREPVAPTRPPPDAPSGRGLWLTRWLYPELTVTTGPAGTTVTLFAART
jgi:anti-sigma regulatory factor (Ser/Thr protein kinase)